MVDDLTAAWSFVMGHIDSVGPRPSVSISPVWVIIDSDEGEDDCRVEFEVVVSGTTEEAR